MRCLQCGRDGIADSETVCPKCGVYLPSILRDVLPPKTTLRGGTYRIDYALGRGGFGITYRAHHEGLDHPVAIKEFYPQEQAARHGADGHLSIPSTQQANYERALQRFIREGRILAKLNHPNVIRVRDQFEERGTAYLVMELLDGHTLRDELDARPGRRLPPELVRRVMEQLVSALDSVHRLGVYHLDLSPDNVILTHAGEAVLVDFGAARQGLSSKSTQAFKLEYAAPEVLAGGDVGPESDLFELGMMLHEMLTGERPPSALKRLTGERWEPEGLEEPWRRLTHSALLLGKNERPGSLSEWWAAACVGGEVKSRQAPAQTTDGQGREMKASGHGAGKQPVALAANTHAAPGPPTPLATTVVDHGPDARPAAGAAAPAAGDYNINWWTGALIGAAAGCLTLWRRATDEIYEFYRTSSTPHYAASSDEPIKGALAGLLYGAITGLALGVIIRRLGRSANRAGRDGAIIGLIVSVAWNFLDRRVPVTAWTFITIAAAPAIGFAVVRLTKKR